jgi:2-oxoglutarate ferredoxin oxidoreductase subunit alpha
VAKNAVVAARKEGIKVGLIRPITLWPFPKAPFAVAKDKCRAFISVELNMGQMIEDIRLATDCSRPVYLCNRAGGMIPGPDEVLESIRKAEKGVI